MKKSFLFGLLTTLVLAGCNGKGKSSSMNGSTNDKIDTRSLIGSVTVDKDTLLFDSRMSEPEVVKVTVNGTFDYDKTASIAVSDASVVSISASEVESNETFTVTPLKVGETVITVKSVQDEEKAAEIEVHVEETKATLSLNPASKVLKFTEGFTLEAISNTQDEIDWTIDAGGEVFISLEEASEANKVIVHAKNQVGHAVVRATTEFLTAICDIDVIKPEVTTKDLYFSEPDIDGWVDTYAHFTGVGNVENEPFPGEKLSLHTINDFNEKVYSMKNVDLAKYDSVTFSNGTSELKTGKINILEMVDKNYIFIPSTNLSDVHFGTYVEPTPYVSFAVEEFTIYKGYGDMAFVSSGHGTVEYTSGNESIAKVVTFDNNGLMIYGVELGDTVITATNAEATDTLTIHVVARPTPTVSDISGTTTFEEFGYTELSCTANLDGAIWSIVSSSSEGVVSLSKEIKNEDTYKVTVKGLKTGTAVIRATNETSYKEVTITVTECNSPQLLYFTNNGSWSNVYLYAFKNTTSNAPWPGEKLENVVKNKFDQDVYAFELNPAEYSDVKFNNGSDDQKTVNISLRDILLAGANNYYVDYEQEVIDNELKVGVATYEAPVDKFAEFASDSSTLIVNQTAHIEVNSNVLVTYESSDSTVVQILEATTRRLTVKGLKAGTSTISVKIDGVVVDVIEVEVTASTTKDFYFYNAYSGWTDFSYYLFKDETHFNHAWPGVPFSGEPYTDQYGNSCYKVNIDMDIYPYVIINAKEGENVKQTRTIELSEVLAGGHDTISMDTEAAWIEDSPDKWVNIGKFETFVAYDANVKFTIYLEVGIDLGEGHKWAEGGAVFFLHAWDSSLLNVAFDVKLTKESDTLYSAQVDKTYKNYVFVRMEGSATEIGWKGDDKYWNQTADLSRQTSNNCFTVTAWGETGEDGVQRSTGYWSHIA